MDFNSSFHAIPKDLPALVLALSVQADYLLTGDGDFAEAARLIAPARIVSVAEMAGILQVSQPGLRMKPHSVQSDLREVFVELDWS